MRALWVSGALTLLMWAQGALAGTVLVVGDSISAALGVDTRQGWVALLQKRLQDRRFRASCSQCFDQWRYQLGRRRAAAGAACAASAGAGDHRVGRQRWPAWPAAGAIATESCADDRRLPRGGGRSAAVAACVCRPTTVSATPRRSPSVYADLAAGKQVALVPFLLEGVGGVPGMMQADGIHPNAQRLSRSCWRTSGRRWSRCSEPSPPAGFRLSWRPRPGAPLDAASRLVPVRLPTDRAQRTARPVRLPCRPRCMWWRASWSWADSPIAPCVAACCLRYPGDAWMWTEPACATSDCVPTVARCSRRSVAVNGRYGPKPELSRRACCRCTIPSLSISHSCQG